MNETFDRLAAEEATKTSALDTVLRPLASTVSVMQTGAHADDETSGLLALLARVHGVRLSYACATRGEGGQNALGPERGDDLAMIRVREMELAAESLRCRLYWLSEGHGDRIRDWRFSKTGEETLDVWGRERTLERMVRILRLEQPDIVCPTFLDVGGQHGHHRAMTRIAREAFDMAGDARAFPQHIAHGLAPWQAAKFYLPAWSGAGDAYDDSEPPPPATLHFDIGAIDPATGVPYARIGEWSRRFHATQGMGQWIEAKSMPRPLHLAASRVGHTENCITDGIPATLAAWADAEPALAADLRAAHDVITSALENRTDLGLLSRALALAQPRVTALRERCRNTSAAPGLVRALTHKIEDIDHALTVVVAGRPAPPVAAFAPPRRADPAISIARADVIINRARPRRSHTVALTVLSSTNVEPSRFGMREHAGLTAHVEAAPDPLSSVIPAQAGTQASPPHARILTLDIDLTLVAQRIDADILLDGAPLLATSTAYYSHTGDVSRAYPARVRIQPVDAHVAPGTRVAYVGCGFDSIDRWLNAIGIDCVNFHPGEIDDTQKIDRVDLDQFSTIVVGIQAFGAHDDLIAALPKLHAFVRRGGHLVTFYHRPADRWSGVPLAPLTIGTPSVRWRTTRADAPVAMLARDHLLLSTPNRIGDADWSGWTKERGLYFASAWDAAYTPLLSMSDPGEAPLAGALLSATFGKGRHTHCALALHTELDALVPGAFRLLANLVQAVR